MLEFEQPATAENVAQSSEPIEDQSPDGQTVAADTAETVAETDEQKNQRVLDERQKRSERAYKGIQRRMGELTAEKYAAQRQAEQLAAVLQSVAGRQQPPQQFEGEPLARKSDEAYEDWVVRKARAEAVNDARQIVARELHGIRQEQSQSRQNEQAVQIRSQFEGRMVSFSKTAPDFHDVVTNNDDVDIPNESAAIVHTMEDGPAVLYAIGKNPALAARLQGKNALQQAMALGQISATLKASPPVSNAPAPGRPVGSRGGPVDGGPSDSDSMEAWVKKRNAQLYRK